jgi:uncharacterized membrane protein
MPADLAPIVVIVFVVFGIMAFRLIKRALDDNKRMKLREMIHRERTLAMEKNMPMENVALEAELFTEPAPKGPRRDAVVWLRLTALFLGLALLFGGVGMCIAFTVSTHPDLTQVWLIGLIPAMVGLGLLIFYAMTAKVAMKGAEPA